MVLRLKTPFSAFLGPFTDVTGCIGLPTALESAGDLALHPAGTGPFKSSIGRTCAHGDGAHIGCRRFRWLTLCRC